MRLVEFRNGIVLGGTQLWMDATASRELCFVSHAHADHLAHHRKIIASPATARLYRRRYGQRTEALICPFNRPFTLGKLRMELLPAGHCLGATQLFVEKDGLRVIYTGDFSLEAGLTTPGAQIKRCDVLVIEATYGEPRYRFPPHEEMREEILAAVDEELTAGHVPCFFATPLGRSQELIALLNRAGHRVRVHSSIYAISRICEQFGVELGPFHQYYRRPQTGEVLVFPTRAVSWSTLNRIKGLVRFAATGWALDEEYSRRFGMDRVFPLSDHADFDDLMHYVEQSRAKEVYTIHGKYENFAFHLRKRRINASVLEPTAQLELF